MDKQGDVTSLLNAWQRGDSKAGEEMLPLVYAELHRIAGRQRNKQYGLLTMQTTDVLHEAWLRLADQNVGCWNNRVQFFAIASTVVRRVLLDSARKRLAQQRDRRQEISLDSVAEPMGLARAEELVELDEALVRLRHNDPRQAQVVDLRYFGGLTIEETALMLDISPATVKRDWEHARAWLYREMHTSPAGLP